MSVHLRLLLSLVAVLVPLLVFSPSAAAPTGPSGPAATVVGQVECDWKYGRSCVVGGGMSFM
ncbi:hypothetical protein [Streptomyces sp. NRRL S-920]|uniref:hypothetical protein n=1 Tax=Streptomyces sp. NRRL S-920 TaxID=1463921 RepID=UPI0004C6D04D|nr:hypothetical protein [Streptomyces sp. NRRL S-920]